MPTYTFRVAGETMSQQADMPDDDAAWRELLTFAGELLCERTGSVADSGLLDVSLHDEHGTEIAALSLTSRRTPRSP